jgi:TatA/E family protein of Tat protein translocase
MPSLSPIHLIIILIIALIVIGPGKLPEVGAALGKSIKEFRKAASDITDSTHVDAAAAPVASAAALVPAPPPAAYVPPAPVTPPPAPAAGTAPSLIVAAPALATPMPVAAPDPTMAPQAATESTSPQSAS